MELVLQVQDGQSKYEKTVTLIRREAPEVTCPDVKCLPRSGNDFNVTWEIARFLPENQKVGRGGEGLAERGGEGSGKRAVNGWGGEWKEEGIKLKGGKGRWVGGRPIWQGVAMDFLKFYPGPPCPTFLRPEGKLPPKRPYGLQPFWIPHDVRVGGVEKFEEKGISVRWFNFKWRRRWDGGDVGMRKWGVVE
jgi:hypothetical protein